MQTEQPVMLPFCAELGTILYISLIMYTLLRQYHTLCLYADCNTDILEIQSLVESLHDCVTIACLCRVLYMYTCINNARMYRALYLDA